MRRSIWTLVLVLGCGARSTLGVVTEGDAATPIDASASTDVVDAATSRPKRVFVTHEKWNGDLISAARAAGHVSTHDGVEAADALCNDTASALGGHFRAWISTSGVDAIDHIADVGPWLDLDGVEIFANKSELASNPRGAILRDERGEITDLAVWTGTLASGVAATDTCRDWSSSSAGDHGVCGLNNTTTQEKWSDGTIPECSGAYNLYCFEQ